MLKVALCLDSHLIEPFEFVSTFYGNAFVRVPFPEVYLRLQFLGYCTLDYVL